jgi:outer membrane protein TolC
MLKLMILLSAILLQGTLLPFGPLPAWAQNQPVAVLTLNECIARALAVSPQINAAREQIRGADAQRMEARAGFFPRVSTSYVYTHRDEAPSFSIPAVPPLLPALTIPMGTRDNYAFNLEVRQPVFTGGALTTGYEASQRSLAISSLEEVVTRENLILEVTLAYYHIGKSRKLLEVAQETLHQLQGHRDVANYFFREGLIPKNDLLLAEVELAQGHQFLIRAGNAHALAQARLNSLLQRELHLPVAVEDFPPPADLKLEFDRLLAQALQNRTEIKIQEERARLAQTMISLRRSDFFPTVSLVGNYQRQGNSPTIAASSQDQANWQLMAMVNWNIFEGGRTRSQVAQKEAQKRQITELLAHLKDQVTLEVKGAYLYLKESQKQITVSHSALGAAEENLRINRLRYAEQVATSVDVLDAQARLTRVVSDYHGAIADYHINLARLNRATGNIRQVFTR